MWGSNPRNETKSESISDYSELSSKHAANLILFEEIFPPTCLNRTYMFIYYTQLLEPTRLLILGKFPTTRSV